MPEAPDVRAQLRIRPRSPLRLPGTGDGMTRADGDGVRRLVHLDGEPVVLAARATPECVLLAVQAPTPELAEAGIARARFWTGVDDDLGPFLERFGEDPLIGPSVTEAPWVRPFRRAMPFDALLAAVCEQLITDERARDIKRSILRVHGRRHAGLADWPDPGAIAALAPAQLQACGLAAGRARALIAVARAVTAGRVDLLDPSRHVGDWRRLRAIPGIGPWTLSSLALHGQGVLDALPAGDHALRVAVGRLHGDRGAPLADEASVIAFFERYAGWRGLAAWHVLRRIRLGEIGGGRPG